MTLTTVSAILAAAIAGCGRPAIERPPTYPVSGHVFIGGQAAVGALVQLWPLDKPELMAHCPHATVEADGSFRMTTYKTFDGAMPGLYAMTLTWPLPARPGMDVGPDRFRGYYANLERPLRRVQIIAGNNELEALRLD